MMEFSDDTSEKGRAALKGPHLLRLSLISGSSSHHYIAASLERKQQKLQKQSTDASKQISALVAADQKVSFRSI